MSYLPEDPEDPEDPEEPPDNDDEEPPLVDEEAGLESPDELLPPLDEDDDPYPPPRDGVPFHHAPDDISKWY